jgi:glyoxylase-like metal-dependent hydrolase (beta-lactamase superfamily II)
VFFIDSNRERKMEALINCYRFKLGDFLCMVIMDGIIVEPKKQLTARPKNQDIQFKQIMNVLCMFVKTQEHSVVIDTGFGRQVRIGGTLQTNVGNMLQNLQHEGIRRSEVDTVILSHIHADHIGGVTDKKGRLTFPNARHVVSKAEWDFWVSKPDLSNVNKSLKQTTLKAINDSLIPFREQFNLLENEIEIVPGVKMIKSPGHTPGHIALQITSDNEKLFCIFDIWHSPIEFTDPKLFESSDMLVEEAKSTRNQIISRITTSNALVFASHFPFPGLGHLLKDNNGCSWKPY